MKRPRVHVCAELGVAHQGDCSILLRLVRAAHDAGADSVKIQVKDPATHATPGKMRESCTAPEGELISELEHRTRMELSDDDMLAQLLADALMVPPLHHKPAVEGIR